MEFRQENLLISRFEEQKEIEVEVGVGSGLAYHLVQNGDTFLILHHKSGQYIP